jgi:hypothetical protein
MVATKRTEIPHLTYVLATKSSPRNCLPRIYLFPKWFGELWIVKREKKRVKSTSQAGGLQA